MDSKIVQVVPQIFYDLIARIIPGFIVLFTAYLIWNDDLKYLRTELFHEETSNVWIALILIAVSYALSLILQGILSVLNLDKKSDKRKPEDFQEVFQGVFEKATIERERPESTVMYYALRLRNPLVGARITKIRAEYRLCETLILGWIIILVSLIAYYCWGRADFFWSPIFVLAFAITGMIFKYRGLKKHYQNSLTYHWLLLMDPGYDKLENKQDSPKA